MRIVITFCAIDENFFSVLSDKCFSAVFGETLVYNFRTTICPQTFCPKRRFIESAPGVGLASEGGARKQDLRNRVHEALHLHVVLEIGPSGSRGQFDASVWAVSYGQNLIGAKYNFREWVLVQFDTYRQVCHNGPKKVLVVVF
jgi:hypothetical protein